MFTGCRIVCSPPDREHTTPSSLAGRWQGASEQVDSGKRQAQEGIIAILTVNSCVCLSTSKKTATRLQQLTDLVILQEVEKEVEKEEMEKAEKNKLKQQLQEQTKEGAATKRQVEEDLKASQAETLKKVRNEEAAKRQQEVNARKQAEAKAKEAQAARVRAEQDRCAQGIACFICATAFSEYEYNR